MGTIRGGLSSLVTAEYVSTANDEKPISPRMSVNAERIATATPMMI